MKEKTQDLRGLAFSIYGRGKVFTHLEKYTEAEADYLKSIALHSIMGEKLGLGMAYYKLGQLYFKWGKIDKAKSTLKLAISFCKQFKIVFVIFKSYYLFYEIAKLQNNATLSLKYLEKYLSIKETVINNQTLKIIENYELIKRMETLEKEAQLKLEKDKIIREKNLAEHASQVRQEFLSTMSHEIRTPLNAVITIASLLNNDKNEEEKKLIQSLRFSANNLLYIVNDILDFSKLDLGKGQLEFSAAQLKTLIQNIFATYQSLAQEKGLLFNLSISQNLADYYLFDVTKLSQILSNLIGNAIKFTERGAVDLKIELIESQTKKDVILFEIKDTGPGIEPENLEKVFDVFSQANASISRKHQGSGLGLAIVKKLIELYGSNIELSSKLNEGSIFSFTLTLEKTKVAAVDLTTNSFNLKGKHVLIVEDNFINAMVAEKILSRWDITSEHAENGRMALELIHKRTFDLILMDIHMPVLNGIDATTIIRNTDNNNRNKPIFALTADVTAGQENATPGLFNGFLLKPIEIEKLELALIENIV
jgi:signal transduction histidine kinase/CheY-like chemotaxis protein